MTTLVIDRQTPPEPLLPTVCAAPRAIAPQREAGDDIVLTPAEEAETYIDPNDYEDDTAYLSALPGVVERLLAYSNLPDSEFEPASHRKR